MKYQDVSSVAGHPAFITKEFGNLLCDTYIGRIERHNDDAEWQGWVMNMSRIGCTKFRLNFVSKLAAVRWTNARLRELGIK